MTAEKSIERSVDTLQRIYAVIAALAINEALKRTFLKGGAAELEIDYLRLPEFLAFMFTVVPFVHGMNRHLDKTLTIIRTEDRPKLFTIIVIDFAVFLVESCVLFLLAASVKAETFFFQLLASLLFLDLLWSVVTWRITRTVVWQWIVVNLAAIVLLIVAIYWLPLSNSLFRLWVLMAIALIRTIFDYVLAWSFYFPRDHQSA